jgi:predicted phosphodiesterase
MKKSVLMIVCNGEPFIEPQLNNLYNIVDEIIIVEGADNIFRQIIKSKTSTDHTATIIKSFPDPDKKIQFYQGDFSDKLKMSSFGCDKITGDYIYQVDVDEFACAEVINKGFNLLDKYECVQMPQRWYYKWGNTYLAGNRREESIEQPGRFFQNKKSDGLYISHIPWLGYRKFIDNAYINAKTTVLDSHGHHFLSIFRWQLEQKMKYYALRGDCNNNDVNQKLKEFDSITINDIGAKKISSYYDKILKTSTHLLFKFKGAKYISPEIEYS